MAVDDDRRRRRWAIDDDRRRRRSAVDDDRRRRRSAADNYPPLELPLRWRDPPPEYPPLELPLKWRNPLPEHIVSNYPEVFVRHSPPLRHHSFTHGSTSTLPYDPTAIPWAPPEPIDSLPSLSRDPSEQLHADFAYQEGHGVVSEKSNGNTSVVLQNSGEAASATIPAAQRDFHFTVEEGKEEKEIVSKAKKSTEIASDGSGDREEEENRTCLQEINNPSRLQKLLLQSCIACNSASGIVAAAVADGKKMIEEKKTQLEHILLHPDTYFGSVEKHTQTLWVYENAEMVHRPVTHVPELYKIFDEILGNVADNKLRDPSINSLKVDIDAEANCNNGDGVPVEIYQEERVYVPEMIFRHLLTRSNYDATQDLRSIADRMIVTGYGRECFQVYGRVCKFAVELCFRHLGIERINIGCRSPEKLFKILDLHGALMQEIDATMRSKENGHYFGIYTDRLSGSSNASKFPQVLAGFPPALMQRNYSSQSPSWKASPRTVTTASSAALSPSASVATPTLVVCGKGFQSKAKNNSNMCLSCSMELAKVKGHMVEMIPTNNMANGEQELIRTGPRIDPFDVGKLEFPGVQRDDYEDFNSKLSELFFGQMICSMISQNGWANTVESMETRSLVSWNTVMDAHKKLGNIEEALILFQAAPETNIASWTSIDTEFARNCYGEEVLQYFVNMQRSLHLPNSSTLSAVLHAYAILTVLGNGLMVQGCAIHHGFEPFVYVFNDLVNMSDKCGEIKSASKVFDEMKEKELGVVFAYVGSRPPDPLCLVGFVLGKASEVGFKNDLYRILLAPALKLVAFTDSFLASRGKYVVASIHGGMQNSGRPKQLISLMNEIMDIHRRRKIFDPG
ncbi:hypothetical protein IEQ34_020337 [Dendrobium chrysotoxum]|uniref:DNA topoisomerase (ATP-hydrolyzing) n=1 Tax=Dendrobium chrysotoxum TaxID=161865 RepID=A0AAV7G1R5_DENCH|nr:hypothetical protein IEQ34_020337 [Dendrobium chrysotoxum]